MILKALQQLYVSSNGDKWELTEDDEKHFFIRHTPNEASGRRQSIMTLAAFLLPDQGGPPQQVLRELIERGDLVVSPTSAKQHFA